MGIRKHIPNALTCCNLLCGCLAIICAFGGHFYAALVFVLWAAIFDFFDGFAARALKSYSPIGKDLDSLADMVSFGISPAIVGVRYQMYPTSLESSSDLWLPLIVIGFVSLLFPLFIAVFSALRLAKFNNDTRQRDNFLGLATPACAILYISLIAFLWDLVNRPDSGYNVVSHSNIWPWVYWLPVAIVPVLCWLLVSEIPMFSMKFRNLSWQDNKVRYIFLLIALVEILMTIVGGFPFSACLCAIIATYIILNILMLAFRRKSLSAPVK